MTPKQRQMLQSFLADGEATDLYEFDGAARLGWHNRERCINSCYKRGWLDENGITDLGRKELAKANT